MSRKVFFLLWAFVLSRIVFTNPLPIFFDSPEYLSRFSNPSYFQAIASGHMPFHAGYIILFWPIFHLASYISLNPSSATIFAQIILSAISIYLLYRFIDIFANKRIAFITTIISSLFPLYWITNVTIMVESAYINLFIISLFFLALYTRKKSKPTLYLLAGCLSFGLSLLTNPLVILWTPLLFASIYYLKKGKLITILLSITLTTLLAVLVNSYFISNASHLSLQNGINQYLFGEDIKIAPDILSITALLRFTRNAFTPILQGNTGIILLLGIISLTQLFKRNKMLFILSFLWILPTILTNQWFDPLLFGRHGAISGFGFAFLASIFLEKRKILFPIVIAYLLIVSIPTLALLRQPIPYLETGKFIETLPKGLLIETHFSRPQTEEHYSGEITYVNQPGWSKDKLGEKIDYYLSSKKPVFVTSQALSDPYGIYSGPFLYPLSLSYARKYELEDILSQYSFSKYATVDKNANIIIFKIISKDESKYPDVPKLMYSQHQIGYFDPVSHLVLFLTDKARIIQSHNIIGG